jgi:hypothetical protein
MAAMPSALRRIEVLAVFEGLPSGTSFADAPAIKAGARRSLRKIGERRGYSELARLLIPFTRCQARDHVQH